MINYLDILKIFNTDWDPIGLNGLEHFNPESDDEYYGYARDVASMLRRGSSPSEISDYLRWAEGHMGVDVSLERIQRITNRLIEEHGKPGG